MQINDVLKHTIERPQYEPNIDCEGASSRRSRVALVLTFFRYCEVEADLFDRMATSSRFATINKEELQKLIKAKDAESTQRSTEVGVKIFKLYLKERLYDPDFEFTAKLN